MSTFETQFSKTNTIYFVGASCSVADESKDETKKYNKTLLTLEKGLGYSGAKSGTFHFEYLKIDIDE